MKTILFLYSIIFLGSCFSQEILPLIMEWPEKELTRPIKPGEMKIEEIPFSISFTDSLEEGATYYLSIKLEHKTTQKDNLSLLRDTVFYIEKDDLDENNQIKKSVYLLITGIDSDVDKEFKIILSFGPDENSLIDSLSKTVVIKQEEEKIDYLAAEYDIVGKMSQTSNTLILYERCKRFDDRREVLVDKKEKSDQKLNWRDRRFYKLYDNLSDQEESISTKKELRNSLKNERKQSKKQLRDDQNKKPLTNNQKKKKEKKQLLEMLKEKRKQSKIEISDSYKNYSYLIESIDIHVSQGRISHIQVKVEGDVGYFVNKGPISLTNFRKRKYYALEYVGSNPNLSGKYIFLKDILNYIPSGNRYYFPTDKTYRFEYEKDEEPILSDGSPVNYFEAKTYSDFQGLSGKENALIQTEINAHFLSNSNALGRSYFTIFQNVNIDIGYSKFDSNFDTLLFKNMDVNFDKPDTLRTALLPITQRSNAFLNLEIDLIRATHVHDAYLKLGHRIYQTSIGLVDSINNAGTSFRSFKRIYSPSFHLTLGGTIYPTKRITADFNLPFVFFYNYDQNSFVTGRNWQMMLTPQIELSYNLSRSLNSADRYARLFFRFLYYDMPYFSGTNYWQTQFGVEIPLSNIMKSPTK